jgi:hypothetical protein
MRRLRIALQVLLPLAAPSFTAAQGSPPRAASCAAPEFRQFDFWIGEWEVRNPDGSKAGTNRIEPILGGCALQENWTGAGGGSGKSFSLYDRTREVWHQTWVDAQGNLLQLDGHFADNRMTLLSAAVRDSSGGTVIHRIVWVQTAPGRVRQLWESSRDGGTTWTVAFDGRYIKR